jgi:hypothetical protein
MIQINPTFSRREISPRAERYQSRSSPMTAEIIP